MKIVVLTSSWPEHRDDPGGRFVLDSCRALAARGHRLVVMPIEAGWRPQGLELRALGPRLPGGAGWPSRLRRNPWLIAPVLARLMQRQDLAEADRVVCHWAVPFPLIAQGAGVDPRRLRTWCHGSGLRVPMAPYLLGKAHPIALVAQHQVDALPRRFRRFARCLPVPVLGPILAPRPAAKRLIFVGRLVPQKGAQLLPSLLDVLPGWRAVVVGDGPLAESLRRDPRITMLGALPPERWPDAVGPGVAVLPSQSAEGSPLTVDELRRAGLPVVVADVPGLADRVRHGCDGWVVAPRHIEAWARALRQAHASPVPPPPPRPGGQDWNAFCDWVLGEA